MIAVVDYGVGNIGALVNMFDYVGVEAVPTSDPAVLLRASKIVLPGVGAFDKAMSQLRSRGLVEPLTEAALERRIPVLGVCLGMQLLARGSEEGCEPGLGWIAADVRRISPPAGSQLKVPHMGWSDVRPTRRSAMFDPEAPIERFYFAHSYHVVCDNRAVVAAVIDYGGDICCAVSDGTISGVQFHPEKSHRYGIRVLTTFAAS